MYGRLLVFLYTQSAGFKLLAGCEFLAGYEFLAGCEWVFFLEYVFVYPFVRQLKAFWGIQLDIFEFIPI